MYHIIRSGVHLGYSAETKNLLLSAIYGTLLSFLH